MIVQHKLQNFNPQQVKLVVRNITEFDSTFVMEPYDQDRILKDGKIAKVKIQKQILQLQVKTINDYVRPIYCS